jgi:glycerophosphoryl diester phosphodiesterase
MPHARPLLAATCLLALSACSSEKSTAGTAAAAPATTAPVATAPVATTTQPPAPSTTEVITTTVAPTAPPTTLPPRITVDALIALDRPLNIAHAGGDQEFPHSTPFAYASSTAAGADVLEMDVQLTGDGVLIVQHDDTVDKTTNAAGPVLSRTLAELQALDNAFWFSPQCWPCQDRPLEEYIYRGVRTGDTPTPAGFTPEDFRVQTFEQVSSAYPDTVLDIEIKGSDTAGMANAKALADEIKRLDRTDSVIVVSFNDAILDEFHRLAPDVAISPGLAAMTKFVLQGTPLANTRVIQIPPDYNGVPVLTAELVAKAKAANIEIWVWASDADNQENAASYTSWLDQGVDGIIAGRPTVLSDLLAKR